MKKYITLAALLTAGSAFANADVDLTQLTKIESGAMSGDGQFSVVLSLDVDGIRSYLEAGQPFKPWGTDIVTYNANGATTGVTINGGSNNEKILSSSLYGRWTYTDNKIDYGPFATGLADFAPEDATSTGWDDVTGIGLVYTFDNKAGTSVALAISGVDYTTSYTTVSGLKASSAGNAAITLNSALVNSAWLSGTVLSADNAKAYAAAAATAIPEPSAFGLLAGLGALALVGTRRRRK